MSQHVLITGGQGRIGSALFLALRDAHHVTSFDDGSNRCVSLAENVSVDITDLDALRFAFKKYGPFDMVFHLAAVTRPERALENPLRCHAVNAGGTLNVLEVLRETRAATVFIFPSADRVDDEGMIWHTLFTAEEYTQHYEKAYRMKTFIAGLGDHYSVQQVIERLIGMAPWRFPRE